MDNHWSRKKVLVTGAGGFIGSHLIERLIDLGADVKGFARYNSRNDWGLLEIIPSQKLDSLQIISGDLQDYDAVFSAVRDVDVIFHLGSLISIPYSYIRPRDTIENNILSTLNILTAARDLGVEKVVHTSSSEVYGTALYVPIDEKHPLQGQSPYSASKIGADKIVESFYCSVRESDNPHDHNSSYRAREDKIGILIPYTGLYIRQRHRKWIYQYG